MTYFEYHLVFNLPFLLLLMWLTRRRIVAAHWKWIGVVCLIAFLFTTPWDNWAVHKGMWGFNWDEVVPIPITFGGVTYRLPLEEYVFFLLETINVSLLVILSLPNRKSAGA